MRDVYELCPILENERFLLRLLKEEDTDDLLKVYSDEKAVPYFNGDNCHGDNFYYSNYERMKEAMKFWLMSYDNHWFVRFTIVDKKARKLLVQLKYAIEILMITIMNVELSELI